MADLSFHLSLRASTSVVAGWRWIAVSRQSVG